MHNSDTANLEVLTFFLSCTDIKLATPAARSQSIFRGALSKLGAAAQGTKVPKCQVLIHVSPPFSSEQNFGEAVVNGLTHEGQDYDHFVGINSSTRLGREEHHTEKQRSTNPTFALGTSILYPRGQNRRIQLEVVVYDDNASGTGPGSGSNSGTAKKRGSKMKSFTSFGKYPTSIEDIFSKMRHGSIVFPLMNRMAMISESSAIVLSFKALHTHEHPLAALEKRIVRSYCFPPSTGIEPGIEAAFRPTPALQRSSLCIEEAGESKLSVDVPHRFLETCLSEMLKTHEKWDLRYNRKRRREKFFNDASEALRHGCDVIRVTVIEARNLKNYSIPSTNVGTSSPRTSSLPKSRGMMFNRWKGQAETWMTAAAAQMSEGMARANTASSVSSNSSSSSNSNSSAVGGAAGLDRGSVTGVPRGSILTADSFSLQFNPFARVAVSAKSTRNSTPQDFVFLGQTNTEYETFYPKWSRNENVANCPHGKPQTEFSIAEGLPVQMENNPRHAGQKQFVYYSQRPSLDYGLEGSLRLEVWNELTKKTMNGSKVDRVCLPYIVSVDFEPLVEKMVETELDSVTCLQLLTTEWFPLTSELSELQDEYFGEVRLEVEVLCCSDSRVAEQLTNGSLDPLPSSWFDDAFWRGYASSRSAPQKDDFESEMDHPQQESAQDVLQAYDSLPLAALEKLRRQYLEGIGQLQELLDVCRVRSDEERWFKSSQSKKEPSLQHLPTNLHINYFYVYEDSEMEGEASMASLRDSTIGGSNLLDFTDIDVDTEAHLTACSSASLAVPTAELKNVVSTVSGGAPTAHALGLQSHGLKELEIEIQTVFKKLYTDRNLHPNSPAMLASIEKVEQLIASYVLRKIICLSQCLALSCASFLSQIDTLDISASLPSNNLSTIMCLDMWKEHGYLLGYESLISSQGKELCMLSDAYVAIRSLEYFQFKLVGNTVDNPEMQRTTLSEENTSSQKPLKSCLSSSVEFLFGSGPKYTIQLSTGTTPCSSFVSNLLNHTVDIVPVLFTQGINEMQSFANIVGHSGVFRQADINKESFSILHQYTEQLRQYETFHGSAIPQLMRELTQQVMDESTASKDTAILLTSSRILRNVNAGRVVYCKSGKDRTAMSVTLEEATELVAAPTPPLPSNKVAMKRERERILSVANVLRTDGVRIAIAEKNIGRPQYSFNALQRKLLPEMYRPPVEAIQDMVTSVSARDS